jgi:hypothetical protein
MVTQANDPIRIKREMGVIGFPRFGLSGGGDPRQLDSLLMGFLKAARLNAGALDFQCTGAGVSGGDLGLLLRALQSARIEPERIPAQPQTAPGQQQGDDQQNHAQPSGRAAHEPRAHGKAFRSSSKCGPSRRVGQSPPQTMAVPCRAAAAFMAAAMRG